MAELMYILILKLFVKVEDAKGTTHFFCEQEMLTSNYDNPLYFKSLDEAVAEADKALPFGEWESVSYKCVDFDELRGKGSKREIDEAAEWLASKSYPIREDSGVVVEGASVCIEMMKQATDDTPRYWD